ncbi:MAG: nucleoside deaminase [Chloroflexota bacterium]
MFWQQLAFPWQVCLEEAWAAYCVGSLPIGAAITDRQGQLLSRGHNRIYDTHYTDNALWGTRVAHAEMNELASIDHRHVDLSEAILYTTTEPCPMCTGAIRMSLVGEVRYASRDPVVGSVVFFEVSPFMQRGQCTIVPPEDPDFEAILIALIIEWVLRDQRPRVLALLHHWIGVSPAAGRLGEELYHTNQLQQWCADNTPTDEVIDALAERLM